MTRCCQNHMGYIISWDAEDLRCPLCQAEAQLDELKMEQDALRDEFRRRMRQMSIVAAFWDNPDWRLKWK